MNLLQLIYPPRCPLCGEPTPWGKEDYCLPCREKLVPKPWLFHTQGERAFDEALSLYEYGDVAGAMYGFKYQGRKEYGQIFGVDLVTRLGEKIMQWQPDALVPVPLHKGRYKKRGYNQAQVLARAVGKELGIPVLPNLVTRSKDTLPQKNLNAAERENNLKKAFKLSQNDVKLSTIVIVDDIYTTGQTVEEIAEVLRQGGAQRIYVLTYAGPSADSGGTYER